MGQAVAQCALFELCVGQSQLPNHFALGIGQQRKLDSLSNRKSAKHFNVVEAQACDLQAGGIKTFCLLLQLHQVFFGLRTPTCGLNDDDRSRSL